MSERGYALFDTALGRCGIAWTPAGVAATSLPDAAYPAARARLARRCEGEEAPPPPPIAEVIARIGRLLSGEPVDLSDAVLDDADAPAFDARVYAQARAIPPGATLTYGEIARRLGEVGLARSVGQALGRNPWPILVPCHRILAADGRSGGFSAPGGATTKLRMLSIERAATSPEPMLFDKLPLVAR